MKKRKTTYSSICVTRGGLASAMETKYFRNSFIVALYSTLRKYSRKHLSLRGRKLQKDSESRYPAYPCTIEASIFKLGIARHNLA